MTTPQVYPLSWPVGRIRRGGNKVGQFKYKDSRGWMMPVTIAMGVDRLQDQVSKLGGYNLLISSNLQVGRNGLPLSKQPKIGDPGVVAYFSLDGHAIALACDTYSAPEQNMAPLAAHVEALRAIERHGVATAEESLRAFEALPSPDGSAPTRTWRDIFGHDITTVDLLNIRYREAAKAAAGDEAVLYTLNIARDQARKELGQ